MLLVRSHAALAEIRTVTAHFASVLWFLRRRRPPNLDPAQRISRALLIDELESYAARGTFPNNRAASPERRPVFIDEEGTRCAFAHMLDFSGHGALALGIHARMNFAPVSEIAEDRRVGAWLQAAGFSCEEIALVQPAYCGPSPSVCICQAAQGPKPTSSDQPIALVSCRFEGRDLEITAVHSPVAGIAVGQKVATKAIAAQDSGAAEYLVWVSPPAPGSDNSQAVHMPSLTIKGNRVDSCMSARSEAVTLPLSKDQAVQAILSPSPDACRKYLESMSETWVEPSPGGGCGDTLVDSSGCNAGALAGSSPASLTVLAAIVGAIAARRLR